MESHVSLLSNVCVCSGVSSWGESERSDSSVVLDTQEKGDYLELVSWSGEEKGYVFVVFCDREKRGSGDVMH